MALRGTQRGRIFASPRQLEKNVALGGGRLSWEAWVGSIRVG